MLQRVPARNAWASAMSHWASRCQRDICFGGLATGVAIFYILIQRLQVGGALPLAESDSISSQMASDLCHRLFLSNAEVWAFGSRSLSRFAACGDLDWR